MKNWKTTIAGVLALLGALLMNGAAVFDNNPATTWNWETIAAAATGIGLLFSRDHDK